MKSELNFCYKIEKIDKVFLSYDELLSYLESQSARKMSGRLVVLFYKKTALEFYRIMFVLGHPVLRYVKFDLS